MAIIRAMSILQAPSGDPKDRYVNTMHFQSQASSITSSLAENVGDALDDFWDAIDGFIPDSLVRQEYRLYDLADDEPREPTFVTATAQPSGDGSPYPYEVAAVLSVYSFRNIRSRRGRVFIGPLTQAAATAGEVNEDPQIASTFRTAATGAALALQTNVQSSAGDGAASWGVYSPTQGVIHPITHAWMDNAFDTMRSRGTAATQRTTVDFGV